MASEEEVRRPKLADCPWPPADSHCSPCTIYLDKDPIGFPIWGEYAGNDNRETFYAQSICFEENPVKRIVFDIGRSKSTAVPEGDGVWIGILDQNAYDYANKFTSGGQINQAWIDTWTISGYLPTMAGGIPTVHEQYCITQSESINISGNYYFVMVTNGSYETCGWQMGGYGDSGFNPGVLPFYRYTEEEPGYTDGYHDVDNYFRGAIILYDGVEDGAIWLPECTIENPYFPSSHPDHTQPYDYEFDLINENQFPCGCPSELSWLITDTSDNPLLPPNTRIANCGSYGAHVDTSETGQGIMFDGPGTITLRCHVGYVSGGSFYTQGYHEFTVVVEPGSADGVITSMSASPNPVPYGGSSTVSLTAKNVGAGPAYFALNIWRDTDDWEYATLNPDQSFTNTRTFSNITSNQTIWGYLWRWDTVAEDWILDDEADVLIQLEGGEVTLEKCITLRDDTWSCDPYTSGSCKCGDEGPQQNTLDWQQQMMCYSKITGDIEGVRHAMVFFFDWGDGLYPVWRYEWDPTPWTGYVCFWAWPSIGSQFGNGIGVVGIYVDGSYIGQSNQFTITGAPQGAIIDWWRKDPRIGPFTPGQQDVLIVGGELTNTGPSGFYYFKLVQNPGTPQENLLSLHGNDLDAGQSMGFGHNLTMPTVAGIYTLGLKIWGDDQNEPSWGSENTQIWDIYVGVTPPCEEYWFQWECEYNGCYWYDDSCHSSLPCSSYTSQSTCEANNCYWWNGSCHDNPPTCSQLNNETDCVAYDCYWWNDSCHDLSPTCEDLDNQADCSAYGCYWYNDVCNSEPLPDLCVWIIDQIQGWPSRPVTDIGIASVMEIIDSFILQIPPPGYTFIPTLQNVFGVIDYYLGFDGDAGTGCDFLNS